MSPQGDLKADMNLFLKAWLYPLLLTPLLHEQWKVYLGDHLFIFLSPFFSIFLPLPTFFLTFSLPKSGFILSQLKISPQATGPIPSRTPGAGPSLAGAFTRWLGETQESWFPSPSPSPLSSSFWLPFASASGKVVSGWARSKARKGASRVKGAGRY